MLDNGEYSKESVKRRWHTFDTVTHLGIYFNKNNCLQTKHILQSYLQWWEIEFNLDASSWYIGLINMAQIFKKYFPDTIIMLIEIKK